MGGVQVFDLLQKLKRAFCEFLGCRINRQVDSVGTAVMTGFGLRHCSARTEELGSGRHVRSLRWNS
jgi:hypothetical protein